MYIEACYEQSLQVHQVKKAQGLSSSTQPIHFAAGFLGGCNLQVLKQFTTCWGTSARTHCARASFGDLEKKMKNTKYQSPPTVKLDPKTSNECLLYQENLKSDTLQMNLQCPYRIDRSFPVLLFFLQGKISIKKTCSFFQNLKVFDQFYTDY